MDENGAQRALLLFVTCREVVVTAETYEVRWLYTIVYGVGLGLQRCSEVVVVVNMYTVDVPVMINNVGIGACN